jgi:protein SCO1/2
MTTFHQDFEAAMKAVRARSVVLVRGFMIVSLICACAGGCFRSQAPQAEGQAEKAAAEPQPRTKKYTLTGEVRKVERNKGEVTIRHDAIPGLMEAMTMPFHVDSHELPEDLREGDQVQGTLTVEREEGSVSAYQLTDLMVTKPALTAALVLDLSKKAPELRPRARRLETGQLVPDLALTDQDGKHFRLSDLRGYVVVLTFIYTRCPLPDFCPTMDRKFAELAQSISAFPRRAEKIRLLSISFDPDHDTPETLRNHARVRGGMPPLWTFAVASHEELAHITEPLGFVYGPGKNEIIHNLCTAVIDPSGKLARLETGTQRNKWSSADLLKTVYSLLPPFQR